MKAVSGPENNNLSERVAQFVVKHITENRLKGGDKIPSEINASASLKISRSVVREAYQSLRMAGIIEIAPGRSPRVGKLRDSTFTPMLQHAVSTEQISPADVLELRAAVEGRAAELAALNRDAAQVQALRQAVTGMRQNRGDVNQFVYHDVQFHEIIGHATGNRLFEILSRSLRTAMEASMRAGVRSRNSEVEMIRVIDTHEAIAEAIAMSQPSNAGHLMAVHFDEAKNALQGVTALMQRSAS